MINEKDFRTANRLTALAMAMIALLIVVPYSSLHHTVALVEALAVIFLWWPQSISFSTRRDIFAGATTVGAMMALVSSFLLLYTVP